MSLNQGSTSTSLLVELEGVPVGKEDETEKGLDIYYIRSLKVGGFTVCSRARLTLPTANRVSTSFIITTRRCG